LSAASEFRGRSDRFYAAKWNIITHDRIREEQRRQAAVDDAGTLPARLRRLVDAARAPVAGE
jgi:hypothetical protein